MPMNGCISGGGIALKTGQITPRNVVPRRQVESHIDRISMHFICEDLNVHMRSQSRFGHHFPTGSNSANSGGNTSGRMGSTGGGGPIALPLRLLLLPQLSQSSAVSQAARMEDDINSFLMQQLSEVNSLVRAHCQSLGGDAVLAYKVEVCEVESGANGNRVYCVLCVSGDVVTLSPLAEQTADISIVDCLWADTMVTAA